MSFTTHEAKVHPPRGARDWVEIASPTPTRFGTEYIVVGRDAGWFRSLRIDVSSGTVFLRHLKIFFHDGFVRTFYLDRLLDRRHPMTDVDLGTLRQIDQLVVTTERYPDGTYTIFGSSGPSGPSETVAEASR